MTARINENTSIPIKIVLPVVLSVVSATWFLSWKLSQIERQGEAVRKQVEAVDQSLRNYWSRVDMVLWSTALQRNNPALTVPPTQ